MCSAQLLVRVSWARLQVGQELKFAFRQASVHLRLCWKDLELHAEILPADILPVCAGLQKIRC